MYWLYNIKIWVWLYNLQKVDIFFENNDYFIIIIIDIEIIYCQSPTHVPKYTQPGNQCSVHINEYKW